MENMIEEEEIIIVKIKSFFLILLDYVGIKSFLFEKLNN